MADLSLPFSDDWVASHAAGAFRPLRKRDPFMRGADVYALQTALHSHFGEITRDGIFGPQTSRVVEKVQQLLGLVVDGIAGGVTQSTLAYNLAKSIGPVYALPEGVPLGHVQQESSGVLGQYTVLYMSGDAKGSRDEGVVQCNTRYYKPEVAFDAVAAIEALCKKVRAFHEKYRGTVEDPRAWRLACGAWNAPAWTDALAKGQSLSDANRQTIEAYIDHVTAYAPSLN